MSLSFTLVDSQIKKFRNALQALAKIGPEVLLVEGVPNRLILRSINPAKSAFLAINFECSFFSTYNVYGGAMVQAGVLIKSVLATFRSSRVRHMQVELQTGGPEPGLSVQLRCDSGLLKRYRLDVAEAEILQASVDRGQLPITVTAEAQSLSSLLASFQSNLEEVTLIALPEPTAPGGSALPGQHSVQIRSFVDPTRGGREQLLVTRLALDARSCLLGYHHGGAGPADVTFNLKDLRSVLGLCEDMGANMGLAFSGPGAPLLAEPVQPPGHPPPPYSAELVLATLLESQYTGEAALAAPPPAPAATGAAAGHPQHQPPGQPHGQAAWADAAAQLDQAGRGGGAGGGWALPVSTTVHGDSPWTGAKGPGQQVVNGRLGPGALLQPGQPAAPNQPAGGSGAQGGAGSGAGGHQGGGSGASRRSGLSRLQRLEASLAAAEAEAVARGGAGQYSRASGGATSGLTGGSAGVSAGAPPASPSTAAGAFPPPLQPAAGVPGLGSDNPELLPGVSSGVAGNGRLGGWQAGSRHGAAVAAAAPLEATSWQHQQQHQQQHNQQQASWQDWQQQQRPPDPGFGGMGTGAAGMVQAQQQQAGEQLFMEEGDEEEELPATQDEDTERVGAPGAGGGGYL